MVDPDIRTHMLGTYRSLRRCMYVVTILFLAALLTYRTFGEDMDGDQKVRRDSISAYYHHKNADLPMRDAFVACLVAVGLLLIAYQGYTDQENWALNVAGAGLICVVAFPMDWPPTDLTVGSTHEKVHYASAIAFFLCIGYVCVRRADDTLEVMPDGGRKLWFKRLYKVFGTLMFCVPVLATGLYFGGVRAYVFWVEFAGVAVFLAYWTTKSFELWHTGLETVPQVRYLEAKTRAKNAGMSDDAATAKAAAARADFAKVDAAHGVVPDQKA